MRVSQTAIPPLRDDICNRADLHITNYAMYELCNVHVHLIQLTWSSRVIFCYMLFVCFPRVDSHVS